MAKDFDRVTELRAIRDVLVGQLVRLEALGEGRTATDLSTAIERLNQLLGEAPSAEEFERLRRNYFLS